VDAWIELAGLVADEEFERRVRQMVLAGEQTTPEVDYRAVAEHAGRAVADVVDPASAEGRRVLDRIVPPAASAADRERLRGQLETFADERVERYWQLVGILNGRPPFTPAIPAYQWVIAALSAQT
jgi:hypothetical protein